VAAGQAGAVQAGDSTRPVIHRVHEVRAGESLWSIARGLVGPEGDPRPVIDELIAANDLAGARILPGQRLSVPAP
jgi:LysM repeat protein